MMICLLIFPVRNERILLQILHFPSCLWLVCCSALTLLRDITTTSFQAVVECPRFLCTPQPEETWLMSSTTYPTIHCSPQWLQKEASQAPMWKRFCHQGKRKFYKLRFIAESITGFFALNGLDWHLSFAVVLTVYSETWKLVAAMKIYLGNVPTNWDGNLYFLNR